IAAHVTNFAIMQNPFRRFPARNSPMSRSVSAVRLDVKHQRGKCRQGYRSRTMERNMNLEQVARRAKVSTATVSRVLNNASVVKNTTRARVMRAIEELKYHPNLHARHLAGGKSTTIGVIVSNLENPFFFDIYKTVENDAHLAGYEVVVANTDYRSEQLVSSIRLMIGRRVAGLAAVVSEMEPALIEELTDSNIPV